MTAVDLDDLLAEAGRYARRTLVGTKTQLVPVFLYIDGAGVKRVIGTPWADDDEKTVALAFVRSKMQHDRAQAYSFVTEWWFARYDHLPGPGELRPAQRSDRQEGVVGLATDGVSTRWGRWAIQRDRRGRITALPPLETSAEDQFASKFANLLSGTA